MLGVGNPFSEKMLQNIDFYTVWEPAWYTKADPPDPANPPDPPEMVHSWQFAPKVTRA